MERVEPEQEEMKHDHNEDDEEEYLHHYEKHRQESCFFLFLHLLPWLLPLVLLLIHSQTEADEQEDDVYDYKTEMQERK